MRCPTSVVESVTEVAIVGYGTVGATLANLLGRAGVSTVVYERSYDPYPLPRACHLAAEVMRIFQAAGLADEVSDVVEPSQGMEFVDALGHQLFTYEDFQRAPILGWEEDYVFQQPLLDAVVRAGVHRLPSVEVRLGSRVSDPDELDARFVVACDGASSDMRQASGIELLDWGYDQAWLVVDLMVDGDPGLPNIIQQVCDPARPTTYVPAAGGHHRWEFCLLDGEDPDEMSQPARVAELLRPWIGVGVGVLLRAVVYRFHAVVADRWREGRMLLAGDAAHQMPPFMGQGLCSGVRDAANLAWKLATVVDGGAPESLLDTYEVERRPHVERCIELSVEAGRLVTDAAPSFPEADVDDDERWSRLPPIRGGVLAEAHHGPRVGHQARQPTVETGGRMVLLDDLAGPWWYLVVRGPVEPSPFVVVNALELGDPDGWLDRLLGNDWAVLIRPDRYIFGVARTPDEVSTLVAEALDRIAPPGA